MHASVDVARDGVAPCLLNAFKRQHLNYKYLHIGLFAISLILAIIEVIVQDIKTIHYKRHNKGDN